MIAWSAGSRRLAFLAMASGLAGCSDLTEESRPPAAAAVPPALLVLPTPPGYPGALTAMQSIRAVRGEDSYDFEAYLEVGSAQVAVVLALPFGPRLAAIDWSAEGIETQRNRGLPRAEVPFAELPPTETFGPQNVLADVVLAFWPEAAVRASLAPEVTLVVEPGTRQLDYRDHPAVTVRYGGRDPWQAETTVIHHLLGYRLAITSRRLPDG